MEVIFAADLADDNEKAAAEVVVRVVGGSFEKTDIGGAQNTHDYEITTNDGTSIALEVTRSLDPAELEFRKVRWPAITGLKHGWYVEAELRFRKKHVELLQDFLIDIEARNPDDAGFIEIFDPVLTKAGLRTVRRASPKSLGPGQIHVYPPAVGAGSYGFEDPTRLVDSIASRADNKKKLCSATSSERHLFVWCHFGSPAIAALVDGTLPTGTLEALDYLDAAWIAGAWTPNAPVLRVTRDGWAKVALLTDRPLT